MDRDISWSYSLIFLILFAEETCCQTSSPLTLLVLTVQRVQALKMENFVVNCAI